MNGHVGKKVAGDGDTVGQYGMGERNTAGENIVQFASQMNMVIMNTYFKKDERHKQTYKSGGSMFQVDYIIVQRREQKGTQELHSHLRGKCDQPAQTSSGQIRNEDEETE